MDAPTEATTRYATSEQRRYVLQRDGFRCRYCTVEVTNESANIDHVLPWKEGGRTEVGNLVTCCHRCNRHKGNRRDLQPNKYPGAGPVPFMGNGLGLTKRQRRKRFNNCAEQHELTSYEKEFLTRRGRL